MTECVFCKIVRNEIPTTLLYEDDVIVAFNDISPVAPVHVLVVPRTHYTDLGDGVPREVLAALFAAVPDIARLTDVAKSGYRVIVNKGQDANQTVGHLHIHIIGGRAMSNGMVFFEG